MLPCPPEEVLPGFRDIAKRVDPELPKLFAELPRTPYGIREIPAFRGETAAHYTPGASDGSRAGYFNANTLKGTTRPRHEMEALLLHEAVPGHHLQIARAQELKGLPDFRRNAFYNAYIEGWGLYAESLGEDLGLYKDPYSKFGRLKHEIFRACRLVVDTGMHSPGLDARAGHRLHEREHAASPRASSSRKSTATSSGRGRRSATRSGS